MFSVLVPVYNAREATELTLRTLEKVGRRYVQETIVVDNSSDPTTTEFVKSLPYITYRYFERTATECTHAHAHAANLGVESVKTPFFLLSDSDVEYFSPRIFQQAVHEFAKDPRVYMVGHMKPNIPMGHYVESQGMESTGVWFFRTEVVRKYIADGITFYPRILREDGIVVRYDFGAYLMKTALADGYAVSQNLDRNAFFHFGAQSRFDESFQVLTNNNDANAGVLKGRMDDSTSLLRERLAARPWDNL